MSAGLSGYMYMFTASYDVPMSFISWTTGKGGREPEILFKLTCSTLDWKTLVWPTGTSSHMGGGVWSLKEGG